ncbi:hypothetical protein [Roseovarius mucosus]|uniref:hypothetical protein n=1 Tax=Roseovarius mucosus TaxID=215743 RepID=UPI0035CF0E97
MNPITATMRLTDLARVMGVHIRSLTRWVDNGAPAHDFGHAPRGVMYALPEVVIFLRANRKRGLFGDDLARVVTFDANERAARAATPLYPDDIWLGSAPEARAGAFGDALTAEERERARLIQKDVAGAAIAAGARRVERLRNITLIHPACARFILTGEGDELPVGHAGWRAWVTALDVVNVPVNELEAA